MADIAATRNERQVISIVLSYAIWAHDYATADSRLLLVFAALGSKSISGLLESPRTKGVEKSPLVELRGTGAEQHVSSKV